MKGRATTTYQILLCDSVFITWDYLAHREDRHLKEAKDMVALAEVSCLACCTGSKVVRQWREAGVGERGNFKKKNPTHTQDHGDA